MLKPQRHRPQLAPPLQAFAQTSALQNQALVAIKRG